MLERQLNYIEDLQQQNMRKKVLVNLVEPARIFRSNGVTIPLAILNFSSMVMPYS